MPDRRPGPIRERPVKPLRDTEREEFVVRVERELVVALELQRDHFDRNRSPVPDVDSLDQDTIDRWFR